MQNQNNNELDALAEELTLQIEINGRGTIRYYNNKDELHRVNGPAVIYPGGSKVWYQNNKLHRLDGPAETWADESKSWYINGVKYSEKDFNKHPDVINYAKSKQQ